MVVTEVDAGRLIPAGAGSTHPYPAHQAPCTAHPRWRGEHLVSTSIHIGRFGSSPLVRGAPLRTSDVAVVIRLIPAGAGSTDGTAGGEGHEAAHPRWRGEHHTFVAPSITLRGSSPLARGALSALSGRACAWRLIPAGAGSTARCARSSRVAAAHPRWRGEHYIVLLGGGSAGGSSPLARGAQPVKEIWAGNKRLIPAGAGSTRQGVTCIYRRPAHPRWRGEHTTDAGLEHRVSGSSPLARGAPGYPSPTKASLWLIPAGAGSTNPTAGCASITAAHPRWRGEHKRY